MADDGLFFIAADGNEVIDTVLAGIDGHRGWLYFSAVAPLHRRCSIGSQLVRHAGMALIKLGCPKLNLSVRSENANVAAFDKSPGFNSEQRICVGKLIIE